MHKLVSPSQIFLGYWFQTYNLDFFLEHAEKRCTGAAVHRCSGEPGLGEKIKLIFSTA